MKAAPPNGAGWLPSPRSGATAAEQGFEREPELDSRVGKSRPAAGPPVTPRLPGDVLVHPDQQRPTLAQRPVVAGPVRRAIAGGTWLAHAFRLTAWIRKVSPMASEL